MVRTVRAVECFNFTGNTVNGEYVIPGALFCLAAQVNPNREGAGAVPNAIPVPGATGDFSVYSTAAGAQLRMQVAFVGGGAPTYRQVLAATLTTSVTTLRFNFPVVPAMRLVIYATAIAPFEIAVTWSST